MISKITYKKVYDSRGSFVGVQLHQENNHITISLGNTDMDVETDTPNWGNVKPIIERFQEEIQEEIRKSTKLPFQEPK